MPYWIHGRDSKTGEPTDPFFSDSDDESAARSEAETQGVRVESVECHIEETRRQEPRQQEQGAKLEPILGSISNAAYDIAKVIAGIIAVGVLAIMILIVYTMLTGDLSWVPFPILGR